MRQILQVQELGAFDVGVQVVYPGVEGEELRVPSAWLILSSFVPVAVLAIVDGRVLRIALCHEVICK